MKQQLTVVKVGGAIIESSEKLTSFLYEFSRIPEPKILVHGGGRDATEMCDQLGINVNMTNGRRITDEASLKVAVMMYAGWINKRISAFLQSQSCNAFGLCGSDLNSIIAQKRDPNPIDYGFVGEISHINVEVLEQLFKLNITPVFSAICHDGKGQLLNVNADTIASELSAALSEHYSVRLIYSFEKSGVLEEIEDETTIISELSFPQFNEMRASNTIYAGMLPKLTNGFNALKKGVNSVQIGRLELITNENFQRTNLTL